MVATIELDDIEIYAYHGCYAEEQKVGNRFKVSITLEVEAKKAAQSDDVNNAVNYVEVVEIVKQEMAIKSHLLENVVTRICNKIWQKFNTKGLLGGTVKVAKLAPPVGVNMLGVSVMMKIEANY